MAKILFLAVSFSMVFLSFSSRAQTIYQPEVLTQEPYFAKHRAKPSDSLFKRDVSILKYFGKFNGPDTGLLKAPVLGTILFDQVSAGKKATYQTIIDYLLRFKETDGYREFLNGFLLYKKLEDKKVSVADWENDKIFFVRMGFTEADLEDFKSYISMPTHQQMTYKEAYSAYMKELDELGPAKPKKDK